MSVSSDDNANNTNRVKQVNERLEPTETNMSLTYMHEFYSRHGGSINNRRHLRYFRPSCSA